MKESPRKKHFIVIFPKMKAKNKAVDTMPASTKQDDVEKGKEAVTTRKNKAISDIEPPQETEIPETMEHESRVGFEEMKDDEIYQIGIVAPGRFWKAVDAQLQPDSDLYPNGLNEVVLEALRRRIKR